MFYLFHLISKNYGGERERGGGREDNEYTHSTDVGMILVNQLN